MGASASDPTQSYYQVLSLISLIQHSFRPPRRHWHTAGRRGPPGRAGPPRASWPSMDSLSLAVSHPGRGPAGLALSDRVPCIAGPGASGCSRLPVTVLRSCLY